MGQYSEAKKPLPYSNIVFTRETPEDEYAKRPDEQDEGFWPSLDPKAPGYIGIDNQDAFEAMKAEAEKRMARFEAGAWSYIGVRAKAVISVPIGGGSICTYTLKSPGLWGIESDSDESYLNEVYMEEVRELLEHIRCFNGALENVRIDKE